MRKIKSVKINGKNVYVDDGYSSKTGFKKIDGTFNGKQLYQIR